MSAQVLDRFCVAGVNYHKADTTVRGMFAVNKAGYARIVEAAKAQNLRSVFVVSTCNRTEIYGFAENVMQLVHLLVGQTAGGAEEFLKYAYLKNGENALDHLMNVSSGLDSQILGDYEILGQLKQAIDVAAEHDMLGPVMNRTVSYALQASKKIKSGTELSTGTVSVSFAAIELLRKHPGIKDKRILVVGAGKFGGNVCRNLVEYLPGIDVTVVNRTDEHAQLLANTSGIKFIPFQMLQAEADNADVIIVCTNASSPTILPQYFQQEKPRLILDLSVPVNVDPLVREIPQVEVIDVDEISVSILDKTFARRKAEVPKAQEILLHYKTEYCNWLLEYRYALHIKSWKDKLQELSEWQPQFCEMAGEKPALIDKTRVQKAVTRLAVNLKTNQEKGCQFINAINDYLQMP